MIATRLSALQNDIAAVTRSCASERAPQLVLVSKFVDPERMREAYDAGHRLFGENRAQELRDKAVALPDDIEWHFIGRLQSNKVKYVVGVAALIHSVDTLSLAEEINAQAAKKGIVQACLLQCNTSGEDTKAGFDPKALVAQWRAVSQLEHISLKGLMTIGSFVDDEKIIRRDFSRLRALKNELNAGGCTSCQELSMGMSDDWRIAVDEGATYLRIGSLVFGERA